MTLTKSRLLRRRRPSCRTTLKSRKRTTIQHLQTGCVSAEARYPPPSLVAENATIGAGGSEREAGPFGRRPTARTITASIGLQIGSAARKSYLPIRDGAESVTAGGGARGWRRPR